MGKASLKRLFACLLVMASLSVLFSACALPNESSKDMTPQITTTSTRFHPVSPGDFMQVTFTPWNTYVIPTNRPTRTATPSLNNSPTFANRVTILRPPTLSHETRTVTLTPPATQYPMAMNAATVYPTSTYQLDSTQFLQDRLVSRCYDTVYRLVNLEGRSAGAPRDHFDEQTGYFVRQPGDFDPNTYFNIFTHLHMLEGYSLDYIFNGDGYMAGYVRLYARPIGDPQLSNIGDYMEYTGITDIAQAEEEINQLSGNYLDYVVGDDTPEAFFQYVLLMLQGSRFYYTGSCWTGHPSYLCDRYDVASLTRYMLIFTQETYDEIEALDTAPSVIMGPDVVQVRIVAYSSYGITESIYWLSRSFPYHVLDYRETQLINFNDNDFLDHPVTPTPH
jgi:hypothetical protein